MITVLQVLCPRCRELTPANLLACSHCGQLLPAPSVSHSGLPPPTRASDLGALVWALVSLFVAIWGLIVAGPLHWLLGPLTHPYLLIAAPVISIILTGLFLAERVTGEPNPNALLSTRDLMALSWTAAALIGAGQIVKTILPPLPVITRYAMLPKASDGCRVEVFIRGEEGDELWRLTGLNRKSEKEIVGIIVRRPGGSSARLPLTESTPQGECAIRKYHLMVNGKESDLVDGAGD